MDDVFYSDGLRIAAHLARPEGAPDGTPRPGLVICHGFPAGSKSAAASAQTYPELANRIAGDTGWNVLTFSFRGAGTSEGSFSIGGWLTDLHSAVDHLLSTVDVDGVWLCGSSTGGALAVCAGGEDERVRGVAALAVRADFDDWAAHPRRFLDHARDVGVISDRSFPPDVDAWTRELREVRPMVLVTKLAPRPLLLVHGTDDDVVPVLDARALADCHGDAELRVISGAGHNLRHDPRAIAVLLGWLERQASDT